MNRPPRPEPLSLVREARRCEEEAQRWEVASRHSDNSVPEMVHALGRSSYWHGQALGWERAARAACGPLRWAWWCRRHRGYTGIILWPAKAPTSPERR